jgi:hypothetical protein
LKKKLTFGRVATSVDTKSDRDEKAKNFLGGPGAPAHQPRDVKQRKDQKEKGAPEADTSVHGEEIQLKIVADTRNDWRISKRTSELLKCH